MYELKPELVPINEIPAILLKLPKKQIQHSKKKGRKQDNRWWQRINLERL